MSRLLADAAWLTLRYLAATPGRSLTLAAALAVALGLPAFTLLAGDRAEAALLARARATPVLVGAPGDTFDLTFAGLYFRHAAVRPLPYRHLAALQGRADCVAAPLAVGHTAGGAPVVGTSPEYLEARGLRVAEGRPAGLLGEVVAGAAVARTHGLAPGRTLRSDLADLHALAGATPLLLEVTGVLAPTGTADDEALFTDVKTTWALDGALHGHGEITPDVALPVAPGDAPTASAALFLFDRLSDETRAGFHLHGAPDDQPLTAVAVFPRDRRALDLVLAQVAADPALRAVRPPRVMAELVTVGHRVADGLRVFFAVVAAATLALVALVLQLSARLRARELALFRRLGAAPRLVPLLFLLEAGALLALAAVGTAGLVGVGALLLDHALHGGGV